MPSMNPLRLPVIVYAIGWAAVFSGCGQRLVAPVPNPLPDSVINLPMSGNFILCYEKAVGGYWNVFISGVNPVNVSLATGVPYNQDDEYPQWSPDGKCILYRRSASIFGPSAHAYDVGNRTDVNLTSDGGVTLLPPQWTPDGRIYCAYQQPVGNPTCTYLMNVNGTDKKKILDFAADIYFYQDSYSFVYRDGSRWYKTNCDNTVNQIVLDTLPSQNQFITVRDFNPATGDFLVNTNSIPGDSSDIATYNAATRQLTRILKADYGYTVALQRYSPDHTKVVFIELGSADQYLSVIDNGAKRRLVHLPKTVPAVTFSYWPMQFSPDGKYVAFSEQVFGTGQWINWVEQLYVVDITTRGLQHIGEGFAPSWNPKP